MARGMARDTARDMAKDMAKDTARDTSKVRVRFAPSPTGFLHIGGARTALFNHLFARHHGGAYLLRIEDTDRARSSQEAVDEILQGLAWLGLESDEAIVYQSAGQAQHAALAEDLLARGAAYRCFATSEELDQMRQAAKAAGKPMRYDRRWRDRDESEVASKVAAGTPFVVRLKAPLEGSVEIEDAVQGTVAVQASALDDMILLRSDGTPTYMLSVVADDLAMNISHVIRGDDHLTNAFRQTLLYRAFDKAPPVFAHIPLLHGADGQKLSKRHGAISVTEYRQAGILPEALCNYLVRLGWAHGDQEIFSRTEMEKLFSLEAVGKSAARFDSEKLEHLNAHWLRQAKPQSLAQEIIPRLNCPLDAEGQKRLIQALPSLVVRVSDLNALAHAAKVYLHAPDGFDDKGSKILSESASDLPARLVRAVEAVSQDNWHAEELEKALRLLAENHTLKFKAVAQPLRVLLTGTTISPPLFEMMEILGRTEVLHRLATAQDLLKTRVP